MSTPKDHVLLTGGGGFLGQRVLRKLAAQGTPVRALVRPGTSGDALSAALAGTDRASVDVHTASMGDPTALAKALTGVGVVLHVAASKTGSAAAQVANTVVSSEALYAAAVAASVRRFVLVSSLGVLGAAGVPRGGTVDERTPIEPHPEWRDPYTFAKVRQEELAWKYNRETGLPLVVVRPGVIFGEGQSLLGVRVGLPLFGLFLHLGRGNTVPLTYVDNCAEAVIAAGFAPGVEGRAFCVVDDDLPTSRYILRRYRRAVDPLAFLPVPFPVLRLVARANEGYSRRTNGHLPAVFTPYKVDALWKGHCFSNAAARQGLHWTPGRRMSAAMDATLASLAPGR
jgi:nucleoside-diphosphate-sugar epimerase